MMLYGLLGLMAMAAGALAIALFALPAGLVRDRIAVAVKEQTGRDLVIAGPASFTVFPSVGISLGDVSLSGAPGFEGAEPLVKMSGLDVSVALWPLLQREVRGRLGFCLKLLEDTGVATAPGVDFDPVEGHRFMRFSFALSTPEIEEALGRLEPWFRDQAGR